MKIDFTKSKVGEIVWSPEYGEVKIQTVHQFEPDEFIVVGGCSYTISGKYEPSNLHPSLFHSESECVEYWAWVGKEEDEEEKEMNLTRLLLSLMKVKETADYFANRCCLFNHFKDCPECMDVFKDIDKVLAEHEKFLVSIKKPELSTGGEG